MNRGHAVAYARELLKLYIEHQIIPDFSGNGIERGTKATDFLTAMNDKLVTYFEKLKDE